MPDCEQVYLEKRRNGATLDVRMRREPQAGEEWFVDNSGKKLPVWKPGREAIAYEAEIFVAAIGCHGFLYAIANTGMLHMRVPSDTPAYRGYGCPTT